MRPKIKPFFGVWLVEWGPVERRSWHGNAPPESRRGGAA